ncbi:response regulator [Paenibacillus massiliensis]|uniref:response regulator n=1 Tax=Paenibacillus massiliensis TaxID=225917 RepID=UPI000470BADC|nr:response regulator [Paenibacillus massiliensis]
MTKMRTVLIADDERLVRIGLMHMVDWERWSMKVVANAPNGQAAWDMYQEHRPDLVFTDIVMPGLDGLELAQRIKEDNPAVKILFLSCHSDFAYAQQGMALGASGYLLKTAMDVQEVDRYLDKITKEWGRSEQEGEAKVPLSGESSENASIHAELEHLYQKWLQERGDADRLNQLIRTYLDRDGYLCNDRQLCNDRDFRSEEHRHGDRLLNSSEQQNAELSSGEAQRDIQAQSDKNQSISRPSEEPTGETVLIVAFGLEEEAQRSWVHELQALQLAGMGRRGPILTLGSTQGMGPLVLMLPETYADEIMLRLVELHHSQPHLTWKRSQLPADTYDYMEEVARMLRNAELEQQYEMHSPSISEPIMQAVRYIDHHVQEPIVSSQLAGHVGLSRSHFSTLFKKEMGISFLDFLHRRRMNKAKELLTSTDWKIHVICEKVGIEDNRHFSKWFKRYTGMTPSEYREKPEK